MPRLVRKFSGTLCRTKRDHTVVHTIKFYSPESRPSPAPSEVPILGAHLQVKRNLQ